MAAAESASERGGRSTSRTPGGGPAAIASRPRRAAARRGRTGCRRCARGTRRRRVGRPVPREDGGDRVLVEAGQFELHERALAPQIGERRGRDGRQLGLAHRDRDQQRARRAPSARGGAAGAASRDRPSAGRRGPAAPGARRPCPRAARARPRTRGSARRPPPRPRRPRRPRQPPSASRAARASDRPCAAPPPTPADPPRRRPAARPLQPPTAAAPPIGFAAGRRQQAGERAVAEHSRSRSTGGNPPRWRSSASTHGWYGSSPCSSLRPNRTAAPSACDAPRELAEQRRLPDPRLARRDREPQRPRSRVGPGRASRRSGPSRPSGRAVRASGGGQGGLRRGRGGIDAPAAHLLDQRPGLRGGRDAELAAQALGEDVGRGQRRRAIAGAREQADQLAVRRLGTAARARRARASRRWPRRGRPPVRRARRARRARAATSAWCSSRARSAQSASRPASNSPPRSATAASRSSRRGATGTRRDPRPRATRRSRASRRPPRRARTRAAAHRPRRAASCARSPRRHPDAAARRAASGCAARDAPRARPAARGRGRRRAARPAGRRPRRRAAEHADRTAWDRPQRSPSAAVTGMEPPSGTPCGCPHRRCGCSGDARGTLSGTVAGRRTRNLIAMTVIVSPPSGAEAAGALAERVLGSALATLDIACIHLGHRLGLYKALSTEEPRTTAEVAARANLDERYSASGSSSRPPPASSPRGPAAPSRCASAARGPRHRAARPREPGLRRRVRARRRSARSPRSPQLIEAFPPAPASRTRTTGRTPARASPDEPADVRAPAAGVAPGRPGRARAPERAGAHVADLACGVGLVEPRDRPRLPARARRRLRRRRRLDRRGAPLVRPATGRASTSRTRPTPASTAATTW